MVRRATRDLSIRLIVDNTGRATAQVEQFAKKSEQGLDRVSKSGRRADLALAGVIARAGAAGKVLGVAGAAGITAGTGFAALEARAIASADALAKQADRIGVNIERLQELRFAAKLAGVEQNTFDASIERFVRRVGEAAQGNATYAKAFKDLGVEIRDGTGQVRTIEALLPDVADAFASIESQTERARLGFALFDRQGVRLLNFLQEGSSAFDTAAEQARNMGAVLDEDVVRRAEQAQNQIDALSQAIGTQFNAALLTALPTVAAFLEDVGEVLTAVDFVVQGLTEIENRTTKRLEFDLAAEQAKLSELRDSINAGANRPELFFGESAGKARELEETLQRISALENEIFERRARGETSVAVGGTAVSGFEGEAAAIEASANALLALEGERIKAEVAAKAALDETIKGLEQELELAGLTTEQRREQVALTQAQQKAGRELTAAERDRITQAVRAADAKKRELERTREVAAELQATTREVSGDFRDSFRDAIAGNISEVEAFTNVFRNLMFDAIADIAEALVFRPIVQGIVGGLTGTAAGAAGSTAGGFLGGLGQSAGGNLVAEIFKSQFPDFSQSLAGLFGFGGAAAALPAGAAQAAALGFGSSAIPGISAAGAALPGLASFALPAAAIAAPFVLKGLFGKEGPPAAGARIGIADNRAFLKATGVDNKGDLSRVLPEVQGLIDLLNSFVAAGGDLSIDDIDKSGLSLAISDIAGKRNQSAGDILRELIDRGAITGLSDEQISAIAGGADPRLVGLSDEIAEVATELSSFADELSTATRETAQAAEAYRRAGEKLDETIQALTLSDLSPLSPAERLAEARGLFSRTFNAAIAGDVEALGDLPSVARGLLSESRSFNASTLPYAQEFDSVIARLQEAGAATENLAIEADAQLVELGKQSELLGEINAALSAADGPNSELLEEQIDVLRDIAGGTGLATALQDLLSADEAFADRVAAIAAGQAANNNQRRAAPPVSGPQFEPEGDAGDGFQFGGAFTVPGVGGPDSQVVRFRATPGERVQVTPANDDVGVLRQEIVALRRQVARLTDLMAAGNEIADRTRQELTRRPAVMGR